MHITQAEEILNKKSGWSALTGTTDFGTISSKAEQGDESCKLAFNILVDRIVGYVGAYFLNLEGKVDALVFAGGIGEKGVQLREAVVAKAKCIGFELDGEKNAKPEDKVVTSISAKGSKFDVLICHTDEQLEMARGIVRDMEGFKKKGAASDL